MRDIDQARHLAWSKMPAYKRRLAHAKSVVEKAMETDATWYCAFSGGKDSTVVYHLTNFQPIHFNDELYLPETTEYFKQIQGLQQIAKQGDHTDFFTSWETGGPEGMEWVEDKTKRSYQIMGEKGYSGVTLGLRCEENNRRRMLLRKNGLLWQLKNGFWYCNPIANWTAGDVWAYIVSNDVPYNKAYDKLRAMGLAEKECRIGPLFQDRVIALGQIAILKAGWPQLYYDLAIRFPEITQYS